MACPRVKEVKDKEVMSSKGTERKKRDREVESPKENEQVFQRNKITVRSPLQSREKENQGDIEMEEVKKMISELATQIRDDMREKELKQARDQLQEQNQEIRDKHKEWKRAKEEIGKRVGEVESQLDRMEREKRRNKVVMMGLEIETGEQKQIIGKVTKFLEEKVKVECKVRNAYKIAEKVYVVEFENREEKINRRKKTRKKESKQGKGKGKGIKDADREIGKREAGTKLGEKGVKGIQRYRSRLEKKKFEVKEDIEAMMVELSNLIVEATEKKKDIHMAREEYWMERRRSELKGNAREKLRKWKNNKGRKEEEGETIEHMLEGCGGLRQSEESREEVLNEDGRGLDWMKEDLQNKDKCLYTDTDSKLIFCGSGTTA
ncbi:golgin subfamily A member 6-like protein 7 [Zophobas morio]|uniref:golgin subfamily A member 6-like protein 7 n=1 Tax=Zophobas morio TaxID=2755281 RepID=UPI003083ECF6